MSRFLVVLIVILLVLVGGIVFLSTRSTEKEPVRMEKVVPLDNLTK
jgi:flagellar basal body-associated protein FliL